MFQKILYRDNVSNLSSTGRCQKKSFMNFVFEILQLFGFVDRIELHDLNSSMGQNVHMN